MYAAKRKDQLAFQAAYAQPEWHVGCSETPAKEFLKAGRDCDALLLRDNF